MTKPIPEGMHSLTPHLICAGVADAIAFYAAAFNATELMRLPGPQGKVMHAMMRLGDSTFMLGEESVGCSVFGPKSLHGSPVIVHHYVENVDAVVERATAAGAKVVMPATDMFWGDRYARLEDPFGHQWSVATHVRDVGPEEMQAAVRAMSEKMGQGA